MHTYSGIYHATNTFQGHLGVRDDIPFAAVGEGLGMREAGPPCLPGAVSLELDAERGGGYTTAVLAWIRRTQHSHSLRIGVNNLVEYIQAGVFT